MLHNGTYQSANTSQAGDHGLRSRVMQVFWRSTHVAVGIILVWLPRTGAWENNLVLWFWPQIEAVALNPFFKGAVVGLGIANILIGVHDVIHAHFAPQGHFQGNVD